MKLIENTEKNTHQTFNLSCTTGHMAGVANQTG